MHRVPDLHFAGRFTMLEGHRRGLPMTDLLFILLALVFFGLCDRYARACERL